MQFVLLDRSSRANRESPLLPDHEKGLILSARQEAVPGELLPPLLAHRMVHDDRAPGTIAITRRNPAALIVARSFSQLLGSRRGQRRVERLLAKRWASADLLDTVGSPLRSRAVAVGTPLHASWAEK
jgi:hypothetical protein